jgi:hypothetical protein
MKVNAQLMRMVLSGFLVLTGPCALSQPSRLFNPRPERFGK